MSPGPDLQREGLRTGEPSQTSAGPGGATPKEPHLNRFVSFALLMMPVLAALGPFVSFDPGSSGTAYGYRVLIALAVIPGVMAALRNRGHDHHVQLLISITLAFGLWGAFALSWAPDPDSGQRQIIGILLGLVGAWVAVGLAANRAYVDSLRSGFVLAAFVMCGVGLWQYFTGQNLWSYFGRPSRFADDQLIGSFINPNNFAAFLLGCAGPLLSWALSGNVKKRVIGFTLLLVSAFIILGTSSRAGVMGLAAITACVLLLAMIRAPRTQVPILATSALTGLAVWATLGAQVAATWKTMFTGGSGASDNLRWELSKTAVQYFWDSSGIGIGPAGFQDRLNAESSQSVVAAHNTLLQIAAEYGVFGFVPVLALIVALTTSALRRPSTTSVGIAPARLEMVAGLIAITVGAIVASSLIADPSWWLLIGYLIVLTRGPSSHEDPGGVEPSPATAKESHDRSELTLLYSAPCEDERHHDHQIHSHGGRPG